MTIVRPAWPVHDASEWKLNVLHNSKAEDRSSPSDQVQNLTGQWMQ
jgi:hypothetical protein